MGKFLWQETFGQGGFVRERRLCPVHGLEHGGSPTCLGQRIIRQIYRRAEAKLFPEVIFIQPHSLAYLRVLIHRLKHNNILCIPGLGGEGYRFVSVEFLGAKQYFATGAVSLAKMTGAVLLPLFCFRRSDGKDYLVLEQPIPIMGNVEGDTAITQAIIQYVRLLESYIRKYPDQWYRWYNLPFPRA